MTSAVRRKPWRVYPLPDREGFCISYYDIEGRRRLHRIPVHLPIKITTQEQAERFAAKWYPREMDRLREERAKRVAADAPPGASGVTFEEFATKWTNGELARLHPDHLKEKVTAKDDKCRLEKYVYPVVGSIPISTFEGRTGIELVERVLAQLPPPGPRFGRTTRRHVIQAMHRVLVLAVYPGKLLVANPLPKGFVPKPGDAKAKTYLYPDEETKLMACTTVPVVERLFYGFQARESPRGGETLALDWHDLDLDRNVINLDENKTDEPRSWALSPDVAEALRRYKKHVVPKSKPGDLIFRDAEGRVLDRYAVAENLRNYLKLAGVSRPQLFENSAVRQQLRAHDLRATFVTVNLALGRSETWISDRTGHKSSQMIHRYKRAARTHAELNLGPLKPLHEAIPELADKEPTISEDDGECAATGS